MIAIVETVTGTFAVDLETEEVSPADVETDAAPTLELNLPRLVAAAAVGATVVAVVDAKPPLLVSHDAGVAPAGAARRATAVVASLLAG